MILQNKYFSYRHDSIQGAAVTICIGTESFVKLALCGDGLPFDFKIVAGSLRSVAHLSITKSGRRRWFIEIDNNGRFATYESMIGRYT
jgi:hypothetical protein